MHVFIDFLQFFDGNLRRFFHFCQFGLFFQDGVLETLQGVRPYAAFGNFVFQPSQIGDVRQELADEVVAVHLDAVEADVADFALQFADIVYFLPQAAAQTFNLTGGKADFQQFVGNRVAVFQVFWMVAAVGIQSLDHQAVAVFDNGKMLQHFAFQFFQIDASHIGGIAFAVFIFVVFGLFFGVVAGTCAGRYGFQMAQAQFVKQHFVRVDNRFDHFVYFDFVVADFFNQFEDFRNRTRAGRNGLNHVFQGVFDFFGDDDFVFARQEFHLPHFAHIHAHGVGGAAEFGVGVGKGGLRFFYRVVVGHAGAAVVHQQAVGIGGFFGYLNTQTLNHVDDVVNLFGVGHVVRQGIVDFGVSDVAAVFALQYQLAQAGALFLCG